MLLKFASSDILHSDLLDDDTGSVIYTIQTKTFLTTHWFHEKIIGTKRTVVRRRRTIVRDSDEKKVAEIVWAGRIPSHIWIVHEMLDNISLLFPGCEGFDSLDSRLNIPTRLNCQWVITKYSLRLNCLESGRTKTAFHLNSVRIFQHFMPAPLSIFANNYLEIKSSSARSRAEMIASFLIVEVLRRNVFNLRPDDFNYHLGPLITDEVISAAAEKSRRRVRTPGLLSKLWDGMGRRSAVSIL